jgi:hypothetical protein
MALQHFIAEHLRITATLVGVPCERMTALEILLEDSTYQVAEATRIVEHAEAVTDFNGTYTGLQALLEAIGEKRGVDHNDGINAAEQVECMEDDEVVERANELLAV